MSYVIFFNVKSIGDSVECIESFIRFCNISLSDQIDSADHDLIISIHSWFHISTSPCYHMNYTLCIHILIYSTIFKTQYFYFPTTYLYIFFCCKYIIHHMIEKRKVTLTLLFFNYTIFIFSILFECPKKFAKAHFDTFITRCYFDRSFWRLFSI